jgi:K+ transporter
VQRHGTHRIGRYFGPIVAVWFVAIGVIVLAGAYTLTMAAIAVGGRALPEAGSRS